MDVEDYISSFNYLKGEIFNRYEVESIIANYLSDLENVGFPFAFVEIGSVHLYDDSISGEHFADLYLTMKSGNKSRIDKIEVNGRNFDPTMDLNRELDNKSVEKWKKVFNSKYRKNLIISYLNKIEEEYFLIQGYEKSRIIDEVKNLDSKGKYWLMKDVYEYNKAKFINRFDRLSYD